MMFNTMAVKDKKALKKTNVKFKPSALAIYIYIFLHNSDQRSVSIIFKDLNFIAFKVSSVFE